MATIRILMVLDGDRWSFADKSPTEENFTMQVLMDTLSNSTSPQFVITKAHRRNDSDADMEGFNFADPMIDLQAFDVIWMIGDEGINGGVLGTFDAPLAPEENLAIARFMDDGGGVFATGDHDGIGSMMCGLLPRVGSMRLWFAAESPPPAGVPTNRPVSGATRGDTLRAAPDGHFYFDSQSDAVPQALTLSSPTHPILTGPSGPITNFPDHMHEGTTTVGWTGFDWNRDVTFVGESFKEYPTIEGHQEKPQIIATGTIIPGHITEVEADYPFSGADPNETAAGGTINTLCAYDGRVAGVGRVVTDASFHHYMDINLTGDPVGSLESGADTHDGFDVPAAMSILDDMKAFYLNTATWLARMPRALTFAVDKSTFGQDEVSVQPAGTFGGALFVIVDGLKPLDFPGPNGITTLSPSQSDLDQWAPHIPSPPGTNIQITPTAVSSDDPMLPQRIQRFTFTYEVVFPDASAFGFPGQTHVFPLQASLVSDPAPPDAFAQIELIKAADPFFDNLAEGNQTSWLSSDVRVFAVVQGDTLFGRPALGPSPADAIAFIQDLAGHITSSQFSGMQTDEGMSAISLLPTTIPVTFPFIPKPVYNFALARVRLTGMSETAGTVRVFFRLFQSQTTASLTYQVDGMGNPIEGFRQTTGPADSQKIALPGISADGSEYISVPCFAAARRADTNMGNNLATQPDGTNVQPMSPPGVGGETFAFFGCWLDNNQSGPGVLPATPAGQANINGPFSGTLDSVMQLMMGAHQCIVAQIVYDEAPIIPGATPSTSDKLAQRNIAFTTIENPGALGSRTAAHTFEIRPTIATPDADHGPDELMIDWRNVPRGTTASIYLPQVPAEDVLALAGKYYATAGLSVVDPHTLQCPVGGITYLPIPKGGIANYAGLFSLEFPRGVRKGQRFDVVVRQLTNAGVQIVEVRNTAGHKRKHDTVISYTRVRSRDPELRQTIEIRQSEPPYRASDERIWRRVYGAFQIAVPVSTRDLMRVPEERLLSVLRWIGAGISPNSRWHPVFMRYLDAIAGRVAGLGGDPHTIPPTPTGIWPGLIEGLEHGGKKGEPVSVHHHHPVHEPEHGEFTGKIELVIYDRFGDFEGFVLETRKGDRRRFESRETRVRDLVNRAWAERIVTTVVASDRGVAEIILHGAPAPLED